MAVRDEDRVEASLRHYAGLTTTTIPNSCLTGLTSRPTKAKLEGREARIRSQCGYLVTIPLPFPQRSLSQLSTAD